MTKCNKDSAFLSKMASCLNQDWVLAKNGYTRIDRCQTELFEAQAELQSYAALVTCLGSCDMDESDLYGVGVAMKRMARRLERVQEKLAKAITSGTK